MSMTYIQLIQQCTFAIWGGGVTLNFFVTDTILLSCRSC